MGILEKYRKKHRLKELSPKESEKGKDVIKISGTDEPMPWDEVYTRIGAGMSLENIAEIYGNIRKIVLFGIEDGIDVLPILSDMVDNEIIQRRKMQEIEKSNPTVARTMKELVNEYAPDVNRDVIMLTKSMVKKAQDLVDDEENTANSVDILNLAKAVQTMTDTLEITQRHSAGVQINNGDIKVEGFTFQLDEGPKSDDAIDVEATQTEEDKQQ